MARYDREPGFTYPRPTSTHEPRPFRPQQYVVYRTVGDIAVDGRLDEESWQLAPWTADFGHIRSALEATVLKVKRNDRRLGDSDRARATHA